MQYERYHRSYLLRLFQLSIWLYQWHAYRPDRSNLDINIGWIQHSLGCSHPRREAGRDGRLSRRDGDKHCSAKSAFARFVLFYTNTREFGSNPAPGRALDSCYMFIEHPCWFTYDVATGNLGLVRHEERERFRDTHELVASVTKFTKLWTRWVFHGYGSMGNEKVWDAPTMKGGCIGGILHRLVHWWCLLKH
jgi:hypothetical protein